MGKVKEFEAFVAAGVQPLSDDAYNVIGLCGESGECAEWVKKNQFRGNKSYTEEMLKLELSDVLHYVTRLALNHKWTLKEIMQANMDKLEKRRGKQSS